MSTTKLFSKSPIHTVLACSRRTSYRDVTFPTFDAYRQDVTKDAAQPSRVTEDDRKGIHNAVVWGLGGALSLLAAKQTIQKIVYYKGMPDCNRVAGSIEVNLSDVPEGKAKTFDWRGKPLFVKHRTAEEVAKVRAVPLSELRDPEPDEKRVKKDEWLIVIGVCTHLGCVPIAGAGDFGGYFCPCHGSHYDASGRIRKGPAPLNLEVPEYEFNGDMVVVGKSA